MNNFARRVKNKTKKKYSSLIFTTMNSSFSSQSINTFGNTTQHDPDFCFFFFNIVRASLQKLVGGFSDMQQTSSSSPSSFWYRHSSKKRVWIDYCVVVVVLYNNIFIHDDVQKARWIAIRKRRIFLSLFFISQQQREREREKLSFFYLFEHCSLCGAHNRMKNGRSRLPVATHNAAVWPFFIFFFTKKKNLIPFTGEFKVKKFYTF